MIFDPKSRKELKNIFMYSGGWTEGWDDGKVVSRGDEGYIYVKAGCHKVVTNML